MEKLKRDIKTDYLARAKELAPFYTYRFPPNDYIDQGAYFADIIADRAPQALDRETLAETLRTQNAHLPNAEAVLANIELLRKDNTWTITTGHQLVLMGGPLYVLYKIATAIRMAEFAAEKHPEHHFVPVFWMASEDHDWEEINHYYTGFEEKHTYSGAFEGAVGRHVFGDEITDLLASAPAKYARHFRQGVTLSAAMRGLMHDLFGQYGLVIIDADDPALKSLLKPWMLREVRSDGMVDAMRHTNELLETAGYKQQVHPRPVNLFYLTDSTRDLVVPTESGFGLKIGTKTWTQGEIEAEIEAYPERFSPNVAMRPLYQEIILPNLAYVGGWGELSYWLQLKSAFAHMNVHFPLLVPRMHATLLTAEQADALQDLGLEASDLAQPLHLLQQQYQDAHWDSGPLHAHNAQVLDSYAALADYLESIDPTLAISLRGEHTRVQKQVDKLEKKVRKALRNKNPKPYAALAALKAAVQPDRQSQQRVLNFTVFAQDDAQPLLDAIFAHCQPDAYTDAWIQLP